MTKRSLKGTAISSRSGLTRDANASIWLSDTTPDSAKDNPLNLTVFQDIIAANIKAMVDGGLVQLTDSTNDCVAFAPSSVISIGGSIYTVDEVFYIYCANNVFKVNTGAATLTDTIRLVVSSTEDGLFQTADIDDGATVTSFGGTTAGDGIINYSDIRWLGSSLSVDIEGGKVDLGLNLTPLTTNTHDLGSSSLKFKDLYVDGVAKVDEITASDGTSPPLLSKGQITSGFVSATITSDSQTEIAKTRKYVTAVQSVVTAVQSNLVEFDFGSGNGGWVMGKVTCYAGGNDLERDTGNHSVGLSHNTFAIFMDKGAADINSTITEISEDIAATGAGTRTLSAINVGFTDDDANHKTTMRVNVTSTGTSPATTPDVFCVLEFSCYAPDGITITEV